MLPEIAGFVLTAVLISHQTCIFAALSYHIFSERSSQVRPSLHLYK